MESPDLRNRFWIMDSLSERTKVSTIKREIEKRADLFKPDLVVIDYIANLSPDKDRRGRNDLEIGDMISDLSHMGNYLKFAVVSGAQIGRDALKKFRSSAGAEFSFNSEDIRGSQEYAAEADHVFAQMLDPNDKNKLAMVIIKNRWGSKEFKNGTSKTVLKVTPEYGLIESDKTYIACSPSEIANKVAQNIISDELDFDDDDDEISDVPTSEYDIIQDDAKLPKIESGSFASAVAGSNKSPKKKSKSKDADMDIF